MLMVGLGSAGALLAGVAAAAVARGRRRLAPAAPPVRLRVVPSRSTGSVEQERIAA
jgi:hypothetical protein